MLKKIAKKKREKIYRCSPPEANFFPLGYQWEKTSFGAPNGKKILLGDQRKQKLPFFNPLEDFFFLLVPQRKFFPLWSSKGKKFAHGGEDRYIFFSNFGNFFQRVKKILKFWNFVKVKVAKFKLNHLG
jgi:hypothetical protein